MNTEKTIRDIMTREVIFVSPKSTFAEVKDLFGRNDFHHLLVVEKGMILKGIMSREDLWQTAYHISFFNTNKKFTEDWYNSYLVEEMMTKNPVTVEPEDTLGLAADIFKANKFRALPVVEGKELIGIVTLHDLLKYAFRDVSA